MLHIRTAERAVCRKPVGVLLIGVEEAPEILTLVEIRFHDVILGHKAVGIGVRREQGLIFGIEKPRMANEWGVLSSLVAEELPRGGVCFVTWNMAVERIGAIKTSVYIYLNPVITVVSSILILHERF